MRIIYPDRIDNGFIHAFLEARDKVRETGEPQPIKGYSGWKVTPVKRDDFE